MRIRIQLQQHPLHTNLLSGGTSRRGIADGAADAGRAD
jgi:hypothetical protein